MPIVNPNEWTPAYVRGNEEECIDILERICGGMKECLAGRDYRTALMACDAICNGVSLLCQLNANLYAPMLYAFSYTLAEICMFGVGGSQGMKAAIPPLQDALDFARDCAKPGRRTEERAKRDAIKIENMLKDIEQGLSIDYLKRTYSPDFPYNIINE